MPTHSRNSKATTVVVVASPFSLVVSLSYKPSKQAHNDTAILGMCACICLYCLSWFGRRDLGILTGTVYVTEIQIMISFSKDCFSLHFLLFLLVFFFISFFLLYYHTEWCQKWALWIFHLALHAQINRMLNRFMHRLCFIFLRFLFFWQHPTVMMKSIENIYFVQ